MNHHNHDHEQPRKKRVPLWKWVVIILLVIAMPLYFAFFKGLQLQGAIKDTQVQGKVQQ